MWQPPATIRVFSPTVAVLALLLWLIVASESPFAMIPPLPFFAYAFIDVFDVEVIVTSPVVVTNASSPT